MKPRLHPLISIFLAIAASSLLLYFITLQTSGNKKAAQTQKAFAAAAIKGKIVFKSLKFGVQLIRVDNDMQTFRLKPAISDNGSLFHANTNLGDSILKKRNSLEIIVKGTNDVTSYIVNPVD